MADTNLDMGYPWIPRRKVNLSAVQREVLARMPPKSWVNARIMGCKTASLARLYEAGLLRMRNRKLEPGEPRIRTPKPVVDLEYYKPD